MAKVIAIDLGTTNSMVSAIDAGQPTIIANQEGVTTTPSVVACGRPGVWLVGQMAKRQAITNPTQSLSSIKRIMGRRHSELRQETKRLPYKVVRGDSDDALVEINDRKHSPPEISAMILTKLREAAGAYLDQDITEAVITVPACFNEFQREATRDAARMAGFRATRVINAPTAAALIYARKKTQQTIAICDFGGGTYDVSIIKVDAAGIVEVLSTSGDTNLGGDDIDQRIAGWLVSGFKKKKGIDLSADPMVLQWLKDAAEKGKIELSTRSETEISLPFVAADATGPKNLIVKFTRLQFEQMCEDIFQRSVGPCKQALHDAGITPAKIDEVLLIGRSARIPRFHTIIKQLFHKTPNMSVNPDEAVAVGAAVYAGVLSGEVNDCLVLDINPHSLGVETLGGVFTKIIGRNTTIPTTKRELFSTAAESQTSVEIKVFQGERPMAKDNWLLRVLSLTDIPPAPRGVPQIEVTFNIDANGILKITAVNRGEGTVRPDCPCLASKGQD